MLNRVGWSAVAWALSLAQPASAYTLNETEDGHAIRWATDRVVMRAGPAFLNMLADGQAPTGLSIALDAWRGYEGVPELTVGEGGAPAPGYHRGEDTNSIHYLQDWPYEREKLAVTVVTYELSSGRMLDADILVNGGAPFRMLDEQGPRVVDAYDLAAVLAHEAGHVLGLGESRADPQATMWPYAHPGDTHQRTLSDDDEAAVLMMYSSAAPATGGCAVKVAESRQSSTAGDIVVRGWLPLVLALLLSRRRRALGP